jgi:pimeloyl-ACP methyl ester carboxylesterase
MATWSTRSRHEVVDDARHYIHHDRPDAVVRAVGEVVDSVRASRSPRPR